MIERTFIQQNIKKINIENFLHKHLEKAGFTGLKMSKTPLVTRIVLHVTRPGLAIGKKGKNIRMLTKELEEKFGIENPQIEIQEISQPELNAKAMVDKMTSLLERGYSWRSVAYRTVEDVMNAGAQGVELLLKGKLAGKGGRKRKERIAVGYMKKAGALSELVEYAKGDAYPKAGAIGVKLRIIKPDIVFPDKVDVSRIGEEEKSEEKPEEEGEKAAETEEKEGKETGEKTEGKTGKKKEEKKKEKKETKTKEEGKKGKKRGEPEKKEVKGKAEKPAGKKGEKKKKKKPAEKKDEKVKK